VGVHSYMYHVQYSSVEYLGAMFVTRVKVKGKIVPVLNQALRHEGLLGEWRYSSTHSLTSALDGGEWSASRPGLFTTMERPPGTHWIGRWVGPRPVLDAVKRKISSPRRESNPRTPIVQHYTKLPRLTSVIEIAGNCRYKSGAPPPSLLCNG
jgi:hypothetical protein